MTNNHKDKLDTVNLFQARIAIITTFTIFGFLFSLWAVHIPLVLHRTDVSKTTLGLLMFLAGVGSWAGTQIGGHIVDRFTSKRITTFYSAWLSMAVLPLALATNVWQLAVAMIILGFGGGNLDIAMNIQAANLEERYKRPIMSSFHAYFSVGSFAGAAVGALMLKLGTNLLTTFSIAAVFGLCVTCASSNFLLKNTSNNDPSDSNIKTRLPRTVWLKVIILGTIAFLLMLAEGVANDWSALQLKQSVHVGNAQAAIGLTVFSIMMTIGRLSTDKIAHKFGPMAVLRYGSAIASAGIFLVIISHNYAFSLSGWALFGLGLSGCVPQLFTAAGNLSSRRQGYIMSRVVGLGYLGLLAGPAVIGGLSHIMNLSTALILPLIFTLVSAFAAKKIIQ